MFDIAVEILVAGLLAYLPFHFGGVLAVSHLVLVVMAALMAACLLLRTVVVPRTGFVWNWIYVPILLFIGFVALQVTPLPVDLLRVISPETVRIKSELLGDPPGNAEWLQWMTISFYPHATWRDLRLLLAIGTIVVVVVNVFRSSQQIKRLLAVITGVGAALAMLGIAQVLTGAEKIFWIIETPWQARAGSFVVHSHYSQFLNLSIGSALGLLLIRLRERAGTGDLHLAELIQHIRWAPSKLDIALAIYVVVGMIAVALSHSRAGILSTLVGLTVSLLLLNHARVLRGIGWPIFGLLFVAFVVLLGSGFNPLYDRFQWLGDAVDARGALIRDTLRTASHFPVTGIGQGAHELVFPMFDGSARPGTAAHAENQLAEILEEVGVVGLVLVIAGAVVAIAALRRSLSLNSSAPAAVFGIAFGLAAVVWHSLSDFGLRIPAVAVLFAVLTALLLCEARRRHSAKHLPRPIGVALTGALLAGLVVAVPAADTARRAQWHWQFADGYTALAESSDDPLRARELRKRLAEHATAAVRLQPDNIKYRYGELANRWQVARREDAETTKVALRCRDEILALRHIAPTYGPLWTLAGQLSTRILGEPRSDMVLRGYRLYPHHPMTCLAAGRELLERHDVDAAIHAFERAATLGSSAKDLLRTLALDLGKPTVALRLAGQDPVRLTALAACLRGMEGEAETVRRRSIARLREQADVDGAPLWISRLVGELCFREQDWESAIKHFRRLLSRDYADPSRMKLARALAALGRYDEAVTEARRLSTLRPDRSKEVKTFIAEFAGRITEHRTPDQGKSRE